jgi:deoxyribodipyrimidine photolyase-related protein
MPRRAIGVWILADQLTPDHPALRMAEAEHGREALRVVLVESRAALGRLPYHRKRQVLIRSAGRHFAAELRERGYMVEVLPAADDAAGLAAFAQQHRPARLYTMEAAEHDTRAWQRQSLEAQAGIPVALLPSTLFLVDRHDPVGAVAAGKKVVMETFYRGMRRHFGLLLDERGEPEGGAWNYDAANRKRLPRGHEPPPLPRFEPDALTRQVMAEVEAGGHGVGSVAGFDLAVTQAQAEAAFADFLEHRLERFGPYEDAMSRQHGALYHAVLSPQMNLGLLEPLAMARAAEERYRRGLAPLNSVEGFIRQVVGWREYIYWQYHRQMPGLRAANAWDGRRALPRLLWDGQTDMACLGRTVERLIDSGYTHHIERLMLVCNFCLLAGVDPAAVADWFLTFYVDSHDWVVLPNVIGMGLNADGGQTATKPYIASAAYIHRMSDHCAACRFRPDQRTGPDACPFNLLYWNFLITHEGRLRANPRLGPAVLGLKHLDSRERAEAQAGASRFLEALEAYGPRTTATPGSRAPA